MSGVAILFIVGYSVGAAISFRFLYEWLVGNVYRRMTSCLVCLGYLRGNSEMSSCSRHAEDHTMAVVGTTLGVIFWPLVAVIASVGTVLKYVWIVSKMIVFPRGNRSKGFLAWQQVVAKVRYDQKTDELRHELRNLGLDPKAWLPTADEVVDYDSVAHSIKDLTYRLSLVSEALKDAKALNENDDTSKDKKRALLMDRLGSSAERSAGSSRTLYSARAITSK